MPQEPCTRARSALQEGRAGPLARFSRCVWGRLGWPRVFWLASLFFVPLGSGCQAEQIGLILLHVLRRGNVDSLLCYDFFSSVSKLRLPGNGGCAVTE